MGTTHPQPFDSCHNKLLRVSAEWKRFFVLISKFWYFPSLTFISSYKTLHRWREHFQDVKNMQVLQLQSVLSNMSTCSSCANTTLRLCSVHVFVCTLVFTLLLLECRSQLSLLSKPIRWRIVWKSFLKKFFQQNVTWEIVTITVEKLS